jgi:hypothetical protein
LACRREFVGAGLDGFRDGDDKASVSVEDVLGVDDRQSGDPMCAWRETEYVSFRGFLAFARLGVADVEVGDITVLVVIGVIEQERSDVDVDFLPRLRAVGFPFGFRPHRRVPVVGSRGAAIDNA